MTKPSKYILREARIDDFETVTALVGRLGLKVPQGSENVRALYRRLWQDNPAVGAGSRIPTGWVLEDSGQIVGFFGNIPRLYYFGETPVIAAVASLWGLEKAYRAQILRLADAYFNQPGIDLLMATTANRAAGRIFEHYESPRLAQPDYEDVLYWVAKPGGFLVSALRKKGFPAPLAGIAGRAGAPVLAAGTVFRRPRNRPLEVSKIAPAEIGAAFDDLWALKLKEPPRLMACRDARSLRWHFQPGPGQPEAVVLTCRREGVLRGYAVLVRDDASEHGLVRLKIADVLIADEEGAVFESLLAAAFENARASGCHILELTGLFPRLRRRALASRPFVRKMPAWPFYYKTGDQTLQKALSGKDAWYTSAFDGDTSLL